MNNLKRITILLAMTFFVVAGVLSQVPQSFKYQVILRGDDGKPIANDDAKITIEILEDSDVVFTEDHWEFTNDYGLINIQIGSFEDLSVIDWSSTDDFFIRISVDDVEYGTSQLLSVPYALYALETAVEDGEDGREIELDVVGDYIQWRYVGETEWNELIPIEDLRGPQGDQGDQGNQGDQGDPGDDGREVELDVVGDYIQWRYVGETDWNELIAIEDLLGPAGPPGPDGDPGPPGDEGLHVVDAWIDGDNHLWIELSNGDEIDAGEVSVTGDGGDIPDGDIHGEILFWDDNAGEWVRAAPQNPGDFMYWSGTAWEVVEAGDDGQVMTFKDGRPQWDDTVRISFGD